jgi:hypothetical protein
VGVKGFVIRLQKFTPKKRAVFKKEIKVAIAEKKLELAMAGLGMIRELDMIGNGVTPVEVSDYEQGMGSGFEIAAEVAAETVMKIGAI